MTKLKGMLPFLAGMLVVFYLLPLLVRDTGSGMFVLLGLVPLCCFALALAYGLMRPFSPLYALFCALLFLPTLWIFFNESAWVYIPAYGAIALLGSGIGALIAKGLRRVS